VAEFARILPAGQGAEPQSGAPEELRQLLAQEIAQWSKVIREAGIKAD
jgi:tripartite-type tricarboxylate transporter receptor subunit TctC